MGNDRKVVPIWERTGVVRSPKMPPSRVDCGLLLSLLTRIAVRHSTPDAEFRDKAADLIQSTIVDGEVSVDFTEDRSELEESLLCVDILARDRNVFGYTIYMPISWFGAEL